MPELIERIEQIMEYETAGDPITGLKWTKKTMEKIAHELNSIGIHVSANTAGKLLKDMNYSLRVNYKKIEATGKTDSISRQERDIQFLYIKQRREEFAERGFPTISVDGKKKELIGNFKNAGRTWRRQAKEVNVYDFKSLAIGRGIPYGIYDLLTNSGLVVIGISYDTPEFAVNSITIWYTNEGTVCYPYKNEILILADCGGSNSSRSTMWKYLIQQNLCNQYGLLVTVCHYPPGTSKYNPIEHRLFSEISKNWAGTPLENYETVIKYIKSTKTKSGLRVEAYFDEKIYEKGIRATDEQMQSINIEYHDVLPKWNYTIKPN